MCGYSAKKQTEIKDTENIFMENMLREKRSKFIVFR